MKKCVVRSLNADCCQYEVIDVDRRHWIIVHVDDTLLGFDNLHIVKDVKDAKNYLRVDILNEGTQGTF